MEARTVADSGGSMMHGAGLAGRYATALYSLADDEGALDATVAEMARLGSLIDASAEFRRLLASPLVDAREGTAASRAVLEAEGFSDRVVRFVGVVAMNRRLGALPDIVRGFARLVADRRGVVTAHVATATPLSPVQREQLRARLIEAGYGSVDIDERVDPALLGGLVLRVGAKLYDSSLKSRLQRLSYAMKGA